ncbi:hypothetical protein LL944_07575 [Lactiplantibacillus pentosus]|uniref:hypothetical protein n=1 Tax=Lactiplantibacillus pentosus TaxID=1589 RepID=UPI001F3BE849|nr:hypothetical protein [Lactiplantibacillus pentosus]MCE6030451.1 hypothetical protein [Lactiplantibacillus pentosus]
MGISEAVRDTDILAIGIPEQVDQSAMRILVTRMLALKTDNPFSYKQLVLLTPTKDVDEKLFDVWSQVACHLNMDLVEVINDVRSAKRAGHHLFQTVATTPVRFVFHYHRHK